MFLSLFNNILVFKMTEHYFADPAAVATSVVAMMLLVAATYLLLTR